MNLAGTGIMCREPTGSAHMVFFYENGSQATVEGEKVSGKLAEDIRAGRVRKMEVAVD